MTTTTEAEQVAAWIAKQIAGGSTVTIGRVYQHTTELRQQHQDQAEDPSAEVFGPSRPWCWDRINQALESLERRS